MNSSENPTDRKVRNKSKERANVQRFMIQKEVQTAPKPFLITGSSTKIRSIRHRSEFEVDSLDEKLNLPAVEDMQQLLQSSL